MDCLLDSTSNQGQQQNSITSTSEGWEGGEANLLRSDPSGTILVLKPELHCLGIDKKIVVGGPNGLKLSIMLASGLSDQSEYIRGRTLHLRTKEALKNCKKALAVVLRHKSPYKGCATTGVLPSGMNIEDYYLYVRQSMYAVELMTPPVFDTNKKEVCMLS